MVTVDFGLREGQMKRFYKLAKEKIDTTTTKVHVSAHCFAHRHSTELLFLSGVLLLTIGLTSIAHAALGDDTTTDTTVTFDDTYIKLAICQLFSIVEGSFGALIMAVSGLGAIVSAAMGGYKAAMTCRVVASGSVILRPIIRLYFGSEVLSKCPSAGSFDVQGKIPTL